MMFALCIYVLWPFLAACVCTMYTPIAFELRECETETAFTDAHRAHCEGIDWNRAIDTARTLAIESESADLIARLSTPRPAYSANVATLAHFGIAS